eukprot:jgi/Picre1/28213/NNA_003619.t1
MTKKTARAPKDKRVDEEKKVGKRTKGVTKRVNRPSKSAKVQNTTKKAAKPQKRKKAAKATERQTKKARVLPVKRHIVTHCLIPRKRGLYSCSEMAIAVMALAADGVVYSWGVNDEGALGRPTNDKIWDESPEGKEHSERGDPYVPGKVLLPSSVRVVQLSAGDSHTCALMDDGCVWSWGTFRDASGVMGFSVEKKLQLIPTEVYAPGEAHPPLVRIASGADHVCAVTENGKLMSWGSGQQGQLGRVGPRMSDRVRLTTFLTPTACAIRRPRGSHSSTVTDVACGTYSTFVTLSDGSIYVCGLNNYGQLGVSGKDIVYSFTLVETGSKHSISRVYPGQHHTLFLTDKDSLLSCGRPTYGRLGQQGADVSSDAPCPAIHPVDGLDGVKVVGGAGGLAVSGCFDQKGSVYLWGFGTSNQLPRVTTMTMRSSHGRWHRQSASSLQRHYSWSLVGSMRLCYTVFIIAIERLGVAMFQGSVPSSRRPNSLLVLVTIFIMLMTVSIYQVSNIALQDHDLMNDLEYVRLKEEHSKKGNSLLPKDFWAHDNVHDATFSQDQQKLRAALGEETVGDMMALCGRTLYHTLSRGYAKSHSLGRWTFVATGDIPDMWIRDSSVQVGIYLSKIGHHPFLRGIIEGLLRTQAFFIVQDPYANAFSPAWRDIDTLDKFSRLLGRGGWVATRNYELDSSVYFIQFLWNYFSHKDIHAPEHLLHDPIVFDAVKVRQGLGKKTGYTGMTWSGFRPSDDPNFYGYSIPSNVYAASALYKLIEMNKVVWMDDALHSKSARLLTDIENGIERYDFDDANLPSLLSLPLLGWPKLDMEVYAATRRRLLDPGINPQYFRGKDIQGIGSEHTMPGYVWPLAMVTEALTDKSIEQRARIAKMLLQTQCGNGLMHESVHANRTTACTRPEFEWANAMFVVMVERSLGYDCDSAAMDFLATQRQRKESDDTSSLPENGDKGDNPLYFGGLESMVQFID